MRIFRKCTYYAGLRRARNKNYTTIYSNAHAPSPSPPPSRGGGIVAEIFAKNSLPPLRGRCYVVFRGTIAQSRGKWVTPVYVVRHGAGHTDKAIKPKIHRRDP